MTRKQATALRYDGHLAPTITAQGEDLIADEIIALAREAGIHIHQEPHLSAFLQQLQLGEAIPEELYQLIAQLIAFVYLLEGKVPNQYQGPDKPIDEQV